MTKTESAIMRTLLGSRVGALTTAPGPYRDTIGSRAHYVCLGLQEAGLGHVRAVSSIAFIFKTHAMIRAEEVAAA